MSTARHCKRHPSSTDGCFHVCSICWYYRPYQNSLCEKCMPTWEVCITPTICIECELLFWRKTHHGIKFHDMAHFTLHHQSHILKIDGVEFVEIMFIAWRRFYRDMSCEISWLRIPYDVQFPILWYIAQWPLREEDAHLGCHFSLVVRLYVLTSG